MLLHSAHEARALEALIAQASGKAREFRQRNGVVLPLL